MKKNYIYLALALIAGLLLGWLFFKPHGTDHAMVNKTSESVSAAKDTVWTCSMHPQIRKDKPGKCPICGMDLIPLKRNAENSDSLSVTLSNEALRLAGVVTAKVTRQNASREIRLYGKVETDERLIQSQVAHFPGRIEKLLVNFTGEKVTSGQTLALIYSPELVTAQQELLEAARTRNADPAVYDAAKEKLHLWKLTEDQITTIEKSGIVRNTFEMKSGSTGIITSLNVKSGDYVTQGSLLFRVADLTSLWVMFDAYENDLGSLNKGDKINFVIEGIPGKSFTGNISYIDPVIDPVTRIARVRAEVKNPSGEIRPEMFATGIISSRPVGFENNITVPKSAVLWTGKRSLVYVRKPGDAPVFTLREVVLGPELGNSRVIVSGLNEDEEIVVNGTFSVDAAAQLEGKPSMMNHKEEGSDTLVP